MMPTYPTLVDFKAADGSWPRFQGEPTHISTMVETYLVSLARVTECFAEDRAAPEEMREWAREWIVAFRLELEQRGCR